MTNYLEVDDLTPDQLSEVLGLATADRPPQVLDGLGVALVFEKPSARTRNSMEMAVVQLGGHPVTIRPDEIGLDTRESVEDVARTLACYHAAIGARVFEHEKVERMAAVAGVPVLNLLSDAAHPMQALADILTIQQELGDPSGRTLAYVGDGNNVCRSLGIAAGMVGMKMRVATPPGHELAESDLTRVSAAGVDPLITTVAAEAVEGADVVYTDVWASMGDEGEADTRRQAFADFSIDAGLMAAAAPNGIFLHCLPAHRGEEVAAEVIDGPQSRVWTQAENRMHAARGLLAWLLDRR